MSKIVLNDVTNLNALSVINDNFDKLEQELQNKVLYRDNPDGESNTLENDVDANGNSLYNIQDLTINGGFTVDGQDVGAYISQAALAAADAEASATAASNSATAASASAIAADALADAAAASEAVATTKAGEASSSASSASSSASTATTQAGIATTQAGIATAQATIATTKASEAASSASSASTSASTATTQAGVATTQATNASASAVDAAASAAAAATALDNFDDRYLGSKSSAPTLDNDGNALVAGALYFNNGTVVTDDKGMWVYDGSQWIAASAASQAILVKYKYIATAGQTTFSGPDANALTLAYTPGSIIVTLNGVVMDASDYTASSGTSVVLASSAALNDEIGVFAFSTFDIANTYTQAQVDSALGTKQNTLVSGTNIKTVAGQSLLGSNNLNTLVSGTAVLASGTSVDFTSIPSWVKRITVMLNGVSTSGSAAYLIQLGSTGGVETSGYVANTLYVSSTANVTRSTFYSNGFGLSWSTGAAGEVNTVTMQFTNLGGNIWTGMGMQNYSTGSGGHCISGQKTLSDTLNRVRITTTGGTDTFDAGSINILYEG